MSRSILVIDGLNLFIRGYVVQNQTYNAAGDSFGGAVWFIKALAYIIRDLKPAKVVVCWEQGGGCPRRKHIYPEYKANRARSKDFKDLYKDGELKPMDDLENKAKQLQFLTKALGFLPVCQVYVPDCEADDIIGYLVRTKFAGYDGQKIIVSTDRDFYQLLEDPSVRIYDYSKRLLIDSAHAQTSMGIPPRNLVLARAMVGDTSDNIAGIPGIGLKTVAKRFTEFQDTTRDLTITEILDHARNEITGNKKAPKCYLDVVNNEAIMRRNWDLMYLGTSTLAASQISKIDFRIEEFKPILNKLEYIRTFTTNDLPVTLELDRLIQELRFLTIT